MWKLFNKKPGSNSLRVLNEKEIQEKLYGRYRTSSLKAQAVPAPQQPSSSGSVTSSLAAVTAENGSASRVREAVSLTNMPHTERADVQPFSVGRQAKSNLPKTVPGEISRPLLRLFKTPALKVIAVIGAATFGFFVLIGMLNNWYLSHVQSEKIIERTGQQPAADVSLRKSMRELGGESQSSAKIGSLPVSEIRINHSKPALARKPAESISPAKSHEPAAGETSALQTAPERFKEQSEALPAPVVPEIPSSEKIYTVQVCTYRSEAEAQKLVGRLQALNLPAYFQAVPSKQEGQPRFYLVFVGRDATYQDAQARLAEFRRLEISKELPGIYVRRL